MRKRKARLAGLGGFLAVRTRVFDRSVGLNPAQGGRYRSLGGVSIFSGVLALRPASPREDEDDDWANRLNPNNGACRSARGASPPSWV